MIAKLVCIQPTTYKSIWRCSASSFFAACFLTFLHTLQAGGYSSPSVYGYGYSSPAAPAATPLFGKFNTLFLITVTPNAFLCGMLQRFFKHACNTLLTSPCAPAGSSSSPRPYSSPAATPRPYSAPASAPPSYSPPVKQSPSPSPVYYSPAAKPAAPAAYYSPAAAPAPAATPKPASPIPAPTLFGAGPVPAAYSPKPMTPAPYATPKPYAPSPYVPATPTSTPSAAPTLFGMAPASPSPAAYGRAGYYGR